MSTQTMLLIIAIPVLLFLWGIVRVRRKVRAEDAALQISIAEINARKERERLEYAGDRDRRTRVDEFWKLPPLRGESAPSRPASPSYGHPSTNPQSKGTT